VGCPNRPDLGVVGEDAFGVVPSDINPKERPVEGVEGVGPDIESSRCIWGGAGGDVVIIGADPGAVVEEVVAPKPNPNEG